MAIYAGSAYVIFEATTLIFPRWGLPDWTIDLVLYLLILGALVTFVMGWIYDLTPDGIQKTEPASETTTKEVSPTSNRWKIASYISLMVIVGLIVLNILPRKNQFSSIRFLENSIAVLPFHNFSEDSDQDYMCLGLTDEITNHLFKISSFEKVVSLNSVLRYRNSDKATNEIAEELEVKYILEGTYKKIGDQIRVTAKLIDPQLDRFLWQKEFDRHFNEIIFIQAEIAHQIAENIDVFLTVSERELIDNIPTSDASAYDLVRKAVFFSYTGTFAMGNQDKVLNLLHEAIRIDPNYADAYAGIGLNLLFNSNFAGENDPITVSSEALSYFNKALAIDSLNASAHRGLGFLNDWLLWDYVKAEEGYLTWMGLEPSSPRPKSAYGEFLIKMNRFNMLNGNFHDSEPSILFVNSFREIRSLIYSGNKQLAFPLIDRFLERFNGRAYAYLGEVFTLIGENDSALFYLESEKIARSRTLKNPRFQACLALSYFKTGQLNRAENIVEQLISRGDTTSSGSPNFYIGWYFSGIGKVDSAFHFLEKSYSNRSPELPWLKVDPILAKLQDDPRYWDLYERTGHKAYDDFLASKKE